MRNTEHRLRLVFPAVLMIITSFTPLRGQESRGEDVPAPERENISSYRLSDGVLLGYYPAMAAIIDLRGRVDGMFESPGFVYYIRQGLPVMDNAVREGDGDHEEAVQDSQPWFVGRIPRGDSVPSFEKELPMEPGRHDILKFFIIDDAAYILFRPEGDDTAAAPPGFIRFSLNEGTLDRKDAVLDAWAAGGKPLCIMERGGEKTLVFNGEEVPLMVKGKPRIASVLLDRIAVIDGEGETELIGLAPLRSLYQFSPGVVMKAPEEFNLLLEAADKAPGDLPPDTESMVFYKIYIDGQEEGRTETGLKEVKKSFRTDCDPGTWHVVKAERWELDKGKKQYFRVNNVYQPEPVKIFIPAKRIVRLSLEYDGREYRFHQSVVME